MASWLVRSTTDQAVTIRALTRDIVLYSWIKHANVTVPLSTQVYKWVPANLMVTGDKRSAVRPFGSYADLTLRYFNLDVYARTHLGNSDAIWKKSRSINIQIKAISFFEFVGQNR